MRSRPILFLILSLMLLATQTSCTRKSTPSGKLRINLGAVAEGPEITAAYIWGHNKTFGLTFGAHISGNGREIELPLKPGIWDFKVMAWSGANMFEGVTRCGYSPDIAFQSGDVDVPIHITTDCSHPFFSGGENFIYTEPNTSTDNQIKPLRLVTCRSVALATGPGSLCENAYEGVTRSFRVILPSYSPHGELEIGDGSLDSLRSECLAISATPTDTELHIPVGDGGPDSPRVYISAFTDDNCSSSENHVVKPYPFGLIGAKAPQGKLFHNNATNRSVFFMKHGASPGKGDLATYFGDGADGIQTIAADVDVSIVPLGGKTISARRRITNISSTSNSSILTVAAFSSPAHFAIGDEVMWHVSIANTLTACDADVGAPYHLVGGSYGFAHVTSVQTTMPFTIGIDHVFPAEVSNLSLNLIKGNITNPPQCVMQVIRVPNFGQLSITGNPTLTANAFSLGTAGNAPTGNGGIIVMRVKDQLNIANGATLTVDQNGSGYPGGDSVTPNLVTFQGVGPDGFTQGPCIPGCESPIGMAAGVGHSGDAGGGGGGHIGAGGNGGEASASMGEGGNQLTLRLFPHFIMMGASGGHGQNLTISSTETGGPGGGIILIAAREILGSSGSGSFQANGNAGMAAGFNGGGGGAGGSVYLFTQFSNVNLTTSARGGAGAAGATEGGGGGGGGKILIQSCMNLGGTETSNISGGALGNGGGTPATAGQPGEHDLSIDSAHPFCP